MKAKKRLKFNKILFLIVWLVLFIQGFSFTNKVVAETYLDEEVQKVWWIGGAANGTDKTLVTFNSLTGSPVTALWKKNAAFTNLNTSGAQKGAVMYTDVFTGKNLKMMRQVYIEGAPGANSQLGIDGGAATGYTTVQVGTFGKAPHKGADYVYAFRNTQTRNGISAELYDLRGNEVYGGTNTPKIESTVDGTGVPYSASINIAPGADPSYYWVIGTDISNQKLVAHKVSAKSGFDPNPVTSVIGVSSRNLVVWNSESDGKATSGGRTKFAMADPVVENAWVLDFDRSTGIATVTDQLSQVSTVPGGFARNKVGIGIAISPSGKYVYLLSDPSGGSGWKGYIWRWDPSAVRVDAIAGQTIKYDYLQLARNGRIYANPTTSEGTRNLLSEITNPDAPAIGSVGYVMAAVNLQTNASGDGNVGGTIATYVYDYGHAPASFESTTLTDGKDGIDYAKHIFDVDVKLGTKNDYDLSSTRNTTLTDENDDGLTFPLNKDGKNSLILGKSNTIKYQVSSQGYLSIWLDSNQNGVWDNDETLMDRQLVTTTGTPQDFIVTIPYDKVPTGSSSWLRARFSSYQADVASPSGFARDGETEDYLVLLDQGDVTVLKEPATGTYSANQEVTYTITYENTSQVNVNEAKISDLLSEVKTKNKTGEEISAYTNWTITAKNLAGQELISGAIVNGTSAGNFTANANLSTTISIATNDKIIYTIVAKISKEAAEPIVNNTNIDLNVVTTDSRKVTKENSSTLTANSPNLEFTYSSGTTNYEPNGTLVYTLVASNTGLGFASKIPVVNLLSQINVDLADGSNGAAFSNWTISATPVGEDTTSGDFANSTDLNTAVDIAAGGSVTYTITGTVNALATGTISNTAKVNGTDTQTVTHTAEGGGNLVITVGDNVNKTSETNTYVPNGTVVYTIEVKNTGTGFATGVNITDPIAGMTAQLADGSTGPAFSNWTISAATTGTSSNAGAVTDNADLSTTATIAPAGSVTYTITGTVNDLSIGTISNTAKVNGTDTQTVTHTADGGGNLVVTVGDNVNKTSGTNTYVPNGTVVYSVEVKNNGTGFATDVNITDPIAGITTQFADGSTGSAFSNWTINSATTGTGSNAGTVTNNANLNVTATIAPAGSVTYTITGTVNGLVTGTISNTAKVNGTDTQTITHTAEGGNDLIVIVGDNVNKTSGTSTYVPNGIVVYTVEVKNNGTGFATDVNITDAISTMTTQLADGSTGSAFSNWTINSAVTGTGTNAGTVADNTNLNAIATIAPAGSVTYTITGTVNSLATGTISNTAQVKGTSTQTVTHTAEGGTDLIVIVGDNVNKTSGTTTYVPNGIVVYTIEVKNNGTGFAMGVNITDAISTMTTQLVDGSTGAAFSNWTISAATTGTGSNAGTVADNANLNAVAVIAPTGSVTYTITGTVNGLATGMISNTAKVNGTDTQTITHTATSGTLVSEFTSNTSTYIPSGTIVYTLKVKNTGAGYLVNIPVSVPISSIQTDWANGTTGAAFSNWTINSSQGPIRSARSADLNEVVAIAPGEEITYTITATVESLASGVINGSASVNNTSTNLVGHTPAPGTLNAIMASTSTNYLPNETIVYTITLTNTGSGFVVNIPVVNLLDQIKTTSADGSTGNAFSGWTIDAITTGVGTSSGSVSPNNNLNTTAILGPNGTITYTISATVTNNARGEISNTAQVNGASLTTIIHSQKSTGLMNLTKRALSPQVMAGGPAGYQILLTNNGTSKVENIYIYDQFPAGFSYVKGSGNQIIGTSESPANALVLNAADTVFGPFALAPGEAFELGYVMKVSSIVGQGKYDNIAIAKVNGVAISNQDRATVMVQVDNFVSTATIVGKVYFDADGDGYQDPAKATKVKIENLDRTNVIAGTITMTYFGEDDKEQEQIKVTSEEEPKITLEIGKNLEGKTLSGNSDVTNKVVIRFELTKPEIGESFTLTTAEGMVLEVDKEKFGTSKSKGEYSKGLTAQAFDIIREIKVSQGRYFFEMTIINVGIQEEGVPGVRLITPEGLTIYTDQFGRYHVPPQIVANSTGKNFIIKLDNQSLPFGMKTVSENPKSKLISAFGLNEIDFEVGLK